MIRWDFKNLEDLRDLDKQRLSDNLCHILPCSNRGTIKPVAISLIDCLALTSE
jgi:hypothetical protein